MAVADEARTVRFGLFEVEPRAGELRKNGVKIKLQEQPFRLLVTLLEHAGDVVTREGLRRELWPTDTIVDFDDGLNAAVKRLRDALDDSAENPRFIETLPRHGYRFIPFSGAGNASSKTDQPSRLSPQKLHTAECDHKSCVLHDIGCQRRLRFRWSSKQHVRTAH